MPPYSHGTPSPEAKIRRKSTKNQSYDSTLRQNAGRHATGQGKISRFHAGAVSLLKTSPGTVGSYTGQMVWFFILADLVPRMSDERVTHHWEFPRMDTKGLCCHESDIYGG